MSVAECLGRAAYFAVNGGFRTVKDGCGMHPAITFKPPYAGAIIKARPNLHARKMSIIGAHVKNGTVRQCIKFWITFEILDVANSAIRLATSTSFAKNSMIRSS